MDSRAPSVRHTRGDVVVEGDDVVVRLSGTRRAGLLGPREAWGTEYRVPLALARATIEGTQFVIRRGDEAVQLVYGCDPAEMEAFVRWLEAYRLRGSMPVAACGHCGAPGQRAGQPCSYCGVAVAG